VEVFVGCIGADGPFVVKCFDAEPQGGTDLIDVLTIEFLDAGRLARVVQTPGVGHHQSGENIGNPKKKTFPHNRLQDEDAHLLLLHFELFEDGEQHHADDDDNCAGARWRGVAWRGV